MSTRGLYAIRKGGVDKGTYNHSNSYPDGLGRDIIEFCKLHTIEELNTFYLLTNLINSDNMPTPEQIKICKDNGYANFSVSTGKEDDWYCLLRNLMGNFNAYSRAIDNNQQIFMEDGIDFIKDSLFCEYAYIINLDNETLEFYLGFQNQADPSNRYGKEPNDSGYYPCKLVMTTNLTDLTNAKTKTLVDEMNVLAENN